MYLNLQSKAPKPGYLLRTVPYQPEMEQGTYMGTSV